MHPKINNILLWAMISIILLFPDPTGAAIKEVTLFPNSALVVETAKIIPQCSPAEKCKAIINIPPQADPESLVVALPANSRMKIDDIQISSVERQDEAKIADLRKQIAKLKDDRKEMQARLQALESQIQFWQMQTKAKTKSVADADNLSAAIGRNVRKLSQDKFTGETDLEKINKQLKELQDKLNQAAGKKETNWQAILTISGPGPQETIFSYHYNLGGCGWLPLYRIEAFPAENNVSFSWDAQLWQSSGEDWKQIQVNLATMQPVMKITPPELPSWIIRPKPQPVYKSLRRETMSAPAMMEKSASVDSENEDSAVVETAKTTYSVWSIGKKNIPAGARQRFKIKEENWPVAFNYLARPSLSPQAFIRASVKFEKSMEIPAGQAIFFIDGAALGKRNFSFAGREGTLFFGGSPLISVTTSKITDQAGEKTIFQDKQTQLWKWFIEANNAGSNNIKLWIEEPAPQVRDERIRLKFKQNPEPLEKDQAKFVWLLDVPAAQKKTIENTIELEAPKDLKLDLGWSR